MTVPERPAGLSERPRSTVPGPGTPVGRYIVEGELGRGGMGVVLAATDPSLQRRVALKVVRPDDDDPQAGERMMREARAMASLSHPNVVAIHDVGVLDDGQIFLAMELVEGRTLRTAMREERSLGSLLDLFLQAGRGLAAAHEAGLVHRDFKPDNVLLGDDGRVRVTDFGLARGDATVVAGTPGRPRTLTATGVVLGTPAYMAPEQHIGVPASQEADQFAFAVSLYEALAGERPFRGSYEEMQTAKLGEGRAPWPPNRPIPPALTRAIDRALLRDPGARYASMSELLAVVEQAVPPPALSGRPGPLPGVPTVVSAPPVMDAPYPRVPPPIHVSAPPPPMLVVAPPPKSERPLVYAVAGVFAALVVLVGVGVALGAVLSRSSSSGSSGRQKLALPGPQPEAPPFVPVMASPTPDSKLPCAAGTSLHRDAKATTIEVYCASTSVPSEKEGPSLAFDGASRRLVRHDTYAKGKLDGQRWTFTNGTAQSMTEFREGKQSGLAYTFGGNGRVTRRDHFENGRANGLFESWSPVDGRPLSSALYRNDQLIGSSSL